MREKRRRRRPKSNVTPRSANITTWMGENVEEINQDSRDRAIDGGNWCEVLPGRLIVIPDGTAEDKDD